MQGFAYLLLFLGIGSFVLPLLGLQFKVLSFFGDATPFVAAGMIAVGAVMLVISLRGSGGTTPPADAV